MELADLPYDLARILERAGAMGLDAGDREEIRWQIGRHPPMALRCPVCNGDVLPYVHVRLGEQLRCGACGRHFELARESERGTMLAVFGPAGPGSSLKKPPPSTGTRNPERATLDEIEADPAYRRRSHRRRTRSP